MKSKITHSRPCTVAHGYTVDESGKSSPVSYALDGKTYSLEQANKKVLREYDRRFVIDSVTQCKYVYEMSVTDFVAHAELVDIIERS